MTARPGDAAVIKATGHDWDAWFSDLDGWAGDLDHKAIAARFSLRIDAHALSLLCRLHMVVIGVRLHTNNPAFRSKTAHRSSDPRH